MGYVIAAGTIIGLSVVSALVGRSLARAETALPPTPERLLSLILLLMTKDAGIAEKKAAFTEGSAVAEALGLPKTAKAIRSESRLPVDETWPGTNQGVLAFVIEKAKKLGILKEVSAVA